MGLEWGSERKGQESGEARGSWEEEDGRGEGEEDQTRERQGREGGREKGEYGGNWLIFSPLFIVCCVSLVYSPRPPLSPAFPLAFSSSLFPYPSFLASPSQSLQSPFSIPILRTPSFPSLLPFLQIPPIPFHPSPPLSLFLLPSSFLPLPAFFFLLHYDPQPPSSLLPPSSSPSLSLSTPPSLLFLPLNLPLTPPPLPFPSPGGRVHRAARDSFEPPGGDRRLLDPSGNHHLRDPRAPPRLRAQAGRSAQALQRGREFPFPLAFSCVLFGRSWMQLHLDLFVCVSMYVYIYTYLYIYIHRIILEHAYIHIHKTETLSIVVF